MHRRVYGLFFDLALILVEKSCFAEYNVYRIAGIAYDDKESLGDTPQEKEELL